MKLHRIYNESTKAQIAKDILTALPLWFGIPTATQKYIEDSQHQVFFAVYKESSPVGFLTLAQHFPQSAEIAVMGVAPEHHRHGVGTLLLQGALAWARQNKVKLLQVKTLAPTVSHAEYAITREFYNASGFVPLEIFPHLWDPENPCLILVKPVS